MTLLEKVVKIYTARFGLAFLRLEVLIAPVALPRYSEGAIRSLLYRFLTLTPSIKLIGAKPSI
jgi:hypothetical protein